MEFQDGLAAQLPTATLISLAGIGKSVAKDSLSCVERRKNDFTNVLRARSEHQRQLGCGIEARGACVQKQLPDFFARRGTTRFPRDRDRQARLPQPVRKPLQLRALAASIQPFEGDEFSAPRTHAEIITARFVARLVAREDSFPFVCRPALSMNRSA